MCPPPPHLPLLTSFPLLCISLPLLQPFWSLCCFIWSIFLQIMTRFALISSSLLYSDVTCVVWPSVASQLKITPKAPFLDLFVSCYFHSLFLILPFALIILRKFDFPVTTSLFILCFFSSIFNIHIFIT